MIEPFTVRISRADLDELQQRLATTRWAPEQPAGREEGAYGFPLSRLRRVVSRWQDFDWRRQEDRLNAYPQFRTVIDGQPVHFLHVRSPHPNALPLLITHGWPGSVIEFLKMIEPLTNPASHGGRAEDAFHVIAPSLPGHGFSDKATETGWGIPRIAGAWINLMRRLGYTRWVAQGGDWGSAISGWMAYEGKGARAAHLNMFGWRSPGVHPETPEEKEYAARAARCARSFSTCCRTRSNLPARAAK